MDLCNDLCDCVCVHVDACIGVGVWVCLCVCVWVTPWLINMITQSIHCGWTYVICGSIILSTRLVLVKVKGRVRSVEVKVWKPIKLHIWYGDPTIVLLWRSKVICGEQCYFFFSFQAEKVFAGITTLSFLCATAWLYFWIIAENDAYDFNRLVYPSVLNVDMRYEYNGMRTSTRFYDWVQVCLKQAPQPGGGGSHTSWGYTHLLRVQGFLK